ncbi:alpha/beta fold hydrolase [Streptomyces sp. F001]|uniref:alpha/beta fold hydrolase n=1 Tax=Streptomyces sp. F001 TaxID=1510026 RepID=UPI001F115F25|nr:alpha/beta fold hydrolase [Streptomyces sp. F001]
MWDRQVPELTKQWRVFRFDLPGQAAPPPTPRAPSPTSPTGCSPRSRLWACSVSATRAALSAPAVGVELALRHPERLASLAVIAASPRFGTADEFRQRGVIVRTNGLDPIARTAPDRWFTAGFAAAQPAITEWAVQMVRTTDPGCYIAACEALATFDVRPELGRVGVPTLVLVGSEDQVTGPAEARTLVAGIPDARLAVVPGASHLVPVEQPAAVTDLLVTHFSTPGSPASTPPARWPSRRPPSSRSSPRCRRSPRRSPRSPRLLRNRWARDGRTRTTPGSRCAGRCSATRTSTARWRRPTSSRGLPGVHHPLRLGEIWGRPGLDRRTRSCITLTALVAGGHLDELAFHVRAALRNGLTPAEIKEVLLQAAVYCGVPAANSAFKVAQQVIREETTPQE